MSENFTDKSLFNMMRAKSSHIRMKQNSSQSNSFNNSPCCSKKIISNQIDETFSTNLCFENCMNMNQIRKLRTEIKEIAQANLNLKRINECLIQAINIKDEKLIDVNSSNKDLRLDNNILNKHINSRTFSPSNSTNKEKESNNDNNNLLKNPNINSFVSNNIKNKFRISSSYKKEKEFDKVKFLLNSPENKKVFLSSSKKTSSTFRKENLIQKSEFEEFNLNENEKKNALKNANSKFIKGLNFISGKPIKNEEFVKKSIISNVNTSNITSKKCSAFKSPDKNIIGENYSLEKEQNASNFISGNKKNSIKNGNADNNNNVGYLFKANNFYEKISRLISKTRKPLKYKNKARVSLLSLSDNQLDKMVVNDVLVNLKKICNNEDEFIEFFKATTEDNLILYCDTIFQMIKDLESSLNLLKRMRNYIEISSGITSNTSINDIPSNLIKDAINIMDCERVSIFVYDSFSDMLEIHTGEGLSRNEIRVPKNIGIVGQVFTKSEIIRVDDCYADERFDRTSDEKTNFRTNTILAAPLRDRDNCVYGAIQSINKKKGKFTDDDESIIGLFSMHIGCILRSAKTNDENISYISKLKNVISIQNKWLKIKSINEFSTNLENNLMNIFSVQNCQLFFYNKAKNNIVKIGKYECTEKSLNIGIIGNVFAKNCYIGIGSYGSSEFYNTIIDIETGMSILTYPINVNGEAKGILQFSYNEKLVNSTKKPKEIDELIINYLLEEIEKWFTVNEKVIAEFFEKPYNITKSK